MDTTDRSLLLSAVRFVRIVRHIGVSIGPGATLDALRALELVGVHHRADVRSALRACLTQRHEQHELFDRAFDVFWSNALGPGVRLAPDSASSPAQSNANALAPRIAQALLREGYARQAPAAQATEHGDYLASFSAEEALRRKDFAQMSAAEVRAAEQTLARLELPLPRLRARRFVASTRGTRVDWRATLRQSTRTGGHCVSLARRQQTRKRPPLVALCDISGSMDRYTRVLLHFLHALNTQGWRLHVFLFGTRLTNVTRQLTHRDIDVALASIAQRVPDWSGGTRIGASLREFNKHWSRRVLGQNASVLLLTDGLDRGDTAQLGAEMQRLRKSCRALLWANPLLSFAGFEVKAAGVRAMLPHARMLPVHNLDSLAQLAAALADRREP